MIPFKNKSIKNIGMTIIILVNFFVIFSISLFFFEKHRVGDNFFKLENKFKTENLSFEVNKNYQFNLYLTDYYGKNKDFVEDPYRFFINQYFHPYYLFSLPWRDKDINAVNIDIININKNGFRISNFIPGRNQYVLLGGSTAFGHYSSSDKNTLAWKIGELNNVNVVNRNAPSWNSHQELIALLKFSENYKLSFSLSLANDIVIYCEESHSEKITDMPENFKRLEKIFSKIQSKKKLNYKKNFGYKKWIKEKIPNTYNMIKRSRINLQQEKTYNNNKICFKDMNKHAEIIAKQFIANQKLMKEISKFRDAKHMVILQPQIDLENEINSKSSIRKIFKKLVYTKVMSDKFCNDVCYDFSNIFSSKMKKNLFFSGNNHNTAYYADNSHLLDGGVEFLSLEISKLINKVLIN